MGIDLKKLEREVAIFSAQPDACIFIFRIFTNLRMNKDLLENEDFAKLYDECMEYLKTELLRREFEGRKKVKKKDQEGFVLAITELYIVAYREEIQVDEKEINDYLEYRKGIWKSTL